MSEPVRALPRNGRVYVGLVTAAGTAVLVQSAVSIIAHPPESHWLLLAALTVLTGSFSIKVPSISARFSVSEAFVFASVFSFSPEVSTVIVAIDTLILTSWLRGQNRSLLRALFNMSAGTVAIWVSAHLFSAIITVPLGPSVRLDRLLLPLASLALSYFAINSALVALALGFERRISALSIWRQNFAWLSLNHLGGASVALLLVTYTRNVDFTALGAVVPLLTIMYLTFRTSLARLEDANSHVVQLNQLYMSTIESLAMAVDAKDQITHGHIRRVQVYAIELAKKLGVTDDSQLKAVEAAALLHDMGKLAIPEYILNKPGRLTSAEFDKMKRHANIGADLLSSIRFPYPVVPIVRYHHENWDGSGYPSGIAGSDIPIGARVLSVVDCFDALTSDRPYRPRLSIEDAFNILRERRGKMYDPLVVDTFINTFAEISPRAVKAGADARVVTTDWGLDEPAQSDASPYQQIRASAAESALLAGFTRNVTVDSPISTAMAAASQCLRQLTPATVFALFKYDAGEDILRCEIGVGDPDGLLSGLTIRIGENVTGWVAANKRTSLNSHAALDLATIAAAFQPQLQSTISCPLKTGGQLVGVLSAYSARDGVFTEAHRYAFEYVATVLAARLAPTARGSSVVAFPNSRAEA